VVSGDRLVLEGMQFFAYHGDVPAERELGSRVDVDVELQVDASAAAASDDLGDALDYVRCYSLIKEVVEGNQYHLLEAIAENIATRLLSEPKAHGVRVRVAKEPPLPGVIRRVAVVIERGQAASGA
jgi:7,8-dihydroneopterin aldolase/epimerase/oxygenase